MNNNRELDQEEVRQRLNEFIEEQGLKVKKVAEMLHLHAQTVTAFRSGGKDLSNKTLVLIDNLMNTYEVKYRVL